MPERFKSFEEFWPYYVGEHSRPRTRLLHFIGTAMIFPLLLLSLFYSIWLLLLIPLTAYGLAWAGHFLVEKNRPATFSYPLWSLRGDFRMFGLMCRGRMQRELSRCKALSGRGAD